MPLNVLVVARWYPSHDEPGRGTFVADQVRALAAAGIGILVACPEPALFTPDVEGEPLDRDRIAPWVTAISERGAPGRPRGWGAPGIPVVRFPAARPTGRGREADPADVAALQSRSLLPVGLGIARTWRVDLVHAHTGLPDGSSAAVLADRLGVPLVVTEHESGLPTRLASERSRSAYRALFAPGRRLVAVSTVLARELTGLLGLPVGDVEVIPNTVDVEAFHPVGPEGRDPDELLWVGSRQVSKGIDQLLVAFALARADRPTLRLRLIGRAVGEGEDARLHTRARELGIETAVRLEPPTDRPGVAAAMERAALFVHPSPRETFGVVAVEALASGLPVAAMPSGGVDEILGLDGAYGEVAEAPTAEALAVAIGRALDRRAGFDPARLRAHAETHYAAPAVAARLIALYRSMLPPIPDEDRPGDEAGPEGSPFRVPSIVVGMRRALVVPRLVGLPAGLAEQLHVLTSAGSGPTGGPVEPQLGSLREVDAEDGFRAAQTRAGGPLAAASGPVRVARAIRHPIRALNLRRLARARPEMAWATRRRAIQEAIRAVPPGDRVEILPIDADDVELVAPLLGDRVVLHPNTLRGLADRIDEGEQPEQVGPPVMDGGSTADRSGEAVPGPT